MLQLLHSQKSAMPTHVRTMACVWTLRLDSSAAVLLATLGIGAKMVCTAHNYNYTSLLVVGEFNWDTSGWWNYLKCQPRFTKFLANPNVLICLKTLVISKIDP